MNNSVENYKTAEEKYPNRHKEIHKSPCKNCPSVYNKKNGVIDPETNEIKTYPKEIIVKEFLFVCAWRPNKLCKGNCDEMSINQDFINNMQTTKL